MTKKDRLFLDEPYPKKFSFDKSVAEVFEDMAQRSIPGYKLQLELIPSIVQQALSSAGKNLIYDLGCSLGSLSLALLQALEPPLKIIAVDSSMSMIAKLDAKIQEFSMPSQHSLKTICQDICELEFAVHKISLLQFVLMFIPQNLRLELLRRIYQSLEPGGICLVSEKTYQQQRSQEIFLQEVYENYKLAQGYEQLEISRKREALLSVLVPETPQELQKKLYTAGFAEVIQVFQCLNFVTFVAKKS